MREKQKYVRTGMLTALTLLISGFLTPLAGAAPSNTSAGFNFTVSPPSVAVTTTPGQPINVDIRIQNQGLSTENVKATIMKFTADGETGMPNLRKFESSDEFASWAQVAPTNFTAAPNEWTTVKLHLDPPKSAAYGYYYAVVFSRQNENKTTQKKANNLQGAVASLVLLDVKAKGAVRKLNVAEFSTGSRSVEFLPINFNVRLRNSGNTHVGVSGSIAISKHGKHIATVDVNSSKGYILPGSYRTFVTKWSDGTPVHKTKTDVNGKPILDAGGQPRQSLSYDKFSTSKLRFGKYDARLVMVYNDGQGNVSTLARLSFWVIPWRIIAFFVVAILLVLVGLWALLGRPFSKNRSKRQWRYGAGRN